MLLEYQDRGTEFMGTTLNFSNAWRCASRRCASETPNLRGRAGRNVPRAVERRGEQGLCGSLREDDGALGGRGGSVCP